MERGGKTLHRSKGDESVLYWARKEGDEYECETYSGGASFALPADFFEETYELWKEGGWLPNPK